MSTNTILVEWLNLHALQSLNTTEDLLDGNMFHQLLKKHLDTYQNQFITPANTNKILNWNNLIKSLEKININISTEDKSHLFQGNLKIVQNLLLQIKNHFQDKKQQLLDLNKIDAKTDPKQTKSLLQLFVLILMKNLHLNIKESVALLSNDSKYLAHVLAKGFKEQIIPVTNMLKDFQKYMPQIQEFCINKQNEVFFIKALKPGLISRFRQISELSLQILVQFSSQTQYPFQTMKNHLISTMVLQYRRHSGLIDIICTAIIKLSKFAKNLLTILISDMTQKEFLVFSYEILIIAQESNQLKQFYSLTKVDELLNLSLDSLMDSNTFQIALLILIKMIQTNPKNVIEEQKKLTKIVNNLEKLNPRKKQQNIVFINGLFTLFDIFYRENVLETQQLFKIIIFKYKHSFNEDDSVIYCQNFLSLLKDFPLFHGSMILMIADAIVQKIEHYKESIFQTDLELLLEVVKILVRKQKQPKTQKSLKKSSQKSIASPDSKNLNKKQKIEKQTLDEEGSQKFFNTLSEMLFEDTNNSVALIKVMVLVIEAFGESPAMIQSTLRIVKVSLAIYFANIRKLSICKQNMKGTIKLDDSNVLIKRKNIDIEFFLRQLINLKNQIINYNSQALLCYSYVQANDKCSSQAEGLANVISLLGNLPLLLKKYQQDLKHVQKSKKSKKIYPQPEQDKKIVQQPQLYNKKIIAPGQSYSDYITKVSKVGNDAQKGIQKFQKGFDEKKKKVLDQQLKKLEQEQRMEQLQKKFTNKVLQKGIKIDPRIQNISKYLYEFDSKDAEIKKQAIYQLRSLHIFNPAEEETNDLEGLKYVLKKYNKILRVFYSNYGGKLKTSPTGVIEQQTQKQYLLHLSNVWKIFKDYELDEFMTIKQAQYLVHKLNTIKRKGYNDPNLLDFEIFQDFIVQASFTMFTRLPKELLGYTIAGMIEETFYQLRMLAGENKIDIRLFDDELTHVEQDESIAGLNLQLKRNSDYILPEGYKKIVQKKVQIYHSFSLNVIDQSYTDVIDLLDQILYEKFHFHIIEPFSEVIINAYAKCLLSKKKQDSEESKEKYFSLNVKKELFKYSGQDRKMARQVAFCLSQIVDCVEHGRKPNIKNKLTHKQTEEEKKKNGEQQQRKRQKRDQEIKKTLQQKTEQNQGKRKQQEEQRIKQANKSEQKKAKKKQYQQSLKKKVEQYQQKKQIDKKKQEEQKTKQRQKSQQVYGKKRKQYLKVAQQIQRNQDINKAIDKIEDLTKDDQAILKQKSKALLKVKTNPVPLKGQMSLKKLQPLKTLKNSVSKTPLMKQDPVGKKIDPVQKKNNKKLLLLPNKAEPLSNQAQK